jgi:hypothetical protein
MTNKTTAIISCIPLITFFAIWFWMQLLIKQKITNKKDRKEYKRVFNKYLKDVFTPLLMLGGLIPIYEVFNKKIMIEKIASIMSILVFMSATIYSYYVFRHFKKHYKNLKQLHGQALLDTVKDENV